jgi:hypothetical protein
MCIAVVGDENVLVGNSFLQTSESKIPASGGNREPVDSDTDEESRPQAQPRPRPKSKQLDTTVVKPQSAEGGWKELQVYTAPVPCITSQLGNNVR